MRRLLTISFGCAIAIALTGCASTQSKSSESMARQTAVEPAGEQVLLHCVFFLLKPEITRAQIDEFIHDCYTLKQIPSVRKLGAGRRDERFTRPDVNVTDYTVGLVVAFDDKAGLDEYIEHPVHKALVETHKDKWADHGVRVFDFNATR